MPDYQKLYITLFHAYTEAILQIDQHNYGIARNVLVTAQLDAEEQYMAEPEEEFAAQSPLVNGSCP